VEIASHARAAESFTALTRVAMSKSSMHRLVLEYGSRLVKQQAAEARRWWKRRSKRKRWVWRERIQPSSETMAVYLTVYDQRDRRRLEGSESGQHLGSDAHSDAQSGGRGLPEVASRSIAIGPAVGCAHVRYNTTGLKLAAAGGQRQNGWVWRQ